MPRGEAEDTRYIDLYADYSRMLADGEKVLYSLCCLPEVCVSEQRSIR